SLGTQIPPHGLERRASWAGSWARRVHCAPSQEESVAAPELPLRLGEWPTPLPPTPSALCFWASSGARSAGPSSPISLDGQGCRERTPVEYHFYPAIPLVLLA